MSDNISIDNNDSNFTNLKSTGLFGKLPFWLFLWVTFLLPIFFLPIPYAHLFFGKQLIFGGVTLIVLTFTLLSFLKKGKIRYLPGRFSKSVLAVLIATFLSAIFSGSVSLSMFGQGYEPGVWFSLFIGFTAVYLIAAFFNSKEKVFYGYLALLIPVIILAVFHLLRLVFGVEFLDFGLFNNETSNTVGRFSDLGILFGLILTLILIILEFFNLKGVPRILAYILLAVSFVFIVIVNMSMIWALVGFFALILAIYIFSFSGSSSDRLFSDNELKNDIELVDGVSDDKPKSKKRISVLVLITLIVSILAYISGSYLENVIVNKLNIAKVDVRPSLGATMDISYLTLQDDPIFGSGLNKFSNQWNLLKHPSTNASIFWDTDFDYGIGFLPTFAVTSGILGILAWICFLISFIYLGFKSVFAPVVDKVGRFLTLMSFSGASFLWLSTIFYAPSNTIIILTFILTGLFLASLVNERVFEFKDFSFSSSSKKSFIGSLVIIVAIVGVLGMGYVLVKNYSANLLFQKGLYEANVSGNLDKAEGLFKKSITLSEQDSYYRVLTDVGLVRVSTILSSVAEEDVSDEVRTAFQNALGATLDSANKAIEINNQNYQNWLSLGKVYESIVPLGVEGAYANARSAYEQAAFLNPVNPGIRLILARLEVVNKDNDKAREFIGQSLGLKPDYTEAAYLLSQIEIAENNTKGAIESLKAASVLSPNDPMVFFRLGLLEFNSASYKDAINSLSRAVNLNPIFANARYFLGLAYEKNRDDESAILQFEQIAITNPDNAEVKKIIANLKAGRNALSGISSPETRNEPPIDENNDEE